MFSNIFYVLLLTYVGRRDRFIAVVKDIYIMLRKKGGVLTKKVYDIWEKEMIAMGFKELIKFLGNEALKLLP